MTERTVTQVRELRRQRWSLWKIATELGIPAVMVRRALHPAPSAEELRACRAFDERRTVAEPKPARAPQLPPLPVRRVSEGWCAVCDAEHEAECPKAEPEAVAA